MAAKKTAKSDEAAQPSKKAPASKEVKATPAKKTAAAKKAPAVKKSAPIKNPQPSLDEIARVAYLNYRRRVDLGIPGDSHSDWLQAEESLKKS